MFSIVLPPSALFKFSVWTTTKWVYIVHPASCHIYFLVTTNFCRAFSVLPPVYRKICTSTQSCKSGQPCTTYFNHSPYHSTLFQIAFQEKMSWKLRLVIVIKIPCLDYACTFGSTQFSWRRFLQDKFSLGDVCNCNVSTERWWWCGVVWVTGANEQALPYEIMPGGERENFFFWCTTASSLSLLLSLCFKTQKIRHGMWNLSVLSCCVCVLDYSVCVLFFSNNIPHKTKTRTQHAFHLLLSCELCSTRVDVVSYCFPPTAFTPQTHADIFFLLASLLQKLLTNHPASSHISFSSFFSLFPSWWYIPYVVCVYTALKI